jgi:hypothetical protein
VQDVTRKEIKDVMFSLKNNKAPSSDGFNAGFFKRIWHIVREDVINVVNAFFQARRMLKKMNATTISLIPKVANPTRLTDFRPISFLGKLTYVLKEEDTNVIRGIPQIYNDNRNIKQQMATG